MNNGFGENQQSSIAGLDQSYYYDERTDQLIGLDGRLLDRRIEGAKWLEASNIPRWLPTHRLSGQVDWQPSSAFASYAFDATYETPGAPTGVATTKAGLNVHNIRATPGSRLEEPSFPNELPTLFEPFSVSSQSHPPSQHVKVIRTRQTSQGHTPHTYNTSGVIRSILQNSGEEHKLYSSFKKSPRPKKFFTVGKVFLTLWAEPAGEPGDRPSSSAGSIHTPTTSAFSAGNYGEKVFSKIRRFIVVREGIDSCTALPVKTYGGEGVSRKGVRKCEHAIIYTGKDVPLPIRREAPSRKESKGLLPQAIRVDADDPAIKLDPMSRIDFGKVYTIEHNVKVRSLGKVNRVSLQPLLYQLKVVWASTMGTLSAPDMEQSKKNHSGTSDSYSVFGWIDAYNTLLANGWTDFQARSVLRSNFQSSQHQSSTSHVKDYSKESAVNGGALVTQSEVDCGFTENGMSEACLN